MDPLRQQIVALLRGGQAHATLEQGLAGLSAAHAGRKPPGAAHSAWELVEHIRIAQWDILEFTRNPEYVSPPWPQGYWPSTPAPPTAAAWTRSRATVKADLAAFAALVANRRNDLLAPLPHVEAAGRCPEPSGHPLPPVEAGPPSDHRERPMSEVAPPPPKKTILLEALLLADHNAYHLGQLIELRTILGVWKP